MPAIPYPLPRNHETLFIECTTDTDEDYRGYPDDDEDEDRLIRDEKVAIVAALVQANSPPLTSQAHRGARPAAATSSTVPTKDFIVFPKLPQEIHDYIWKQMMLMSPRVGEYKPGGFKVPGFVNACRESRKALRKHYELRISMLIRNGYQSVPSYGIFINWEIDVVNFGSQLDYYEAPNRGRRLFYTAIDVWHEHEPWCHKIQRLAINLENTNKVIGSHITRQETVLLETVMLIGLTLSI